MIKVLHSSIAVPGEKKTIVNTNQSVVATRLFGLIIFSMGARDVDGLATSGPAASAGAFG